MYFIFSILVFIAFISLTFSGLPEKDYIFFSSGLAIFYMIVIRLHKRNTTVKEEPEPDTDSEWRRRQRERAEAYAERIRQQEEATFRAYQRAQGRRRYEEYRTPPSSITPYEVLEVPVNATKEEIKKAYRIQAKKWHPDNNLGKDTTARMQAINQAYKTLK